MTRTNNMPCFFWGGGLNLQWGWSLTLWEGWQPQGHLNMQISQGPAAFTHTSLSLCAPSHQRFSVIAAHVIKKKKEERPSVYILPPIFYFSVLTSRYYDSPFSLSLLLLSSSSSPSLPPSPLIPLCFSAWRDNHSALNSMGARGRITMTYSIQSYNAEQLAPRPHTPRRCYRHTLEETSAAVKAPFDSTTMSTTRCPATRIGWFWCP